MFFERLSYVKITAIAHFSWYLAIFSLSQFSRNFAKNGVKSFAFRENLKTQKYSHSSQKILFLQYFGALNWVNFSLHFRNHKSIKIRASKWVKTAIFELLDSPKLISRKIWVTEKYLDFHIVLKHFHQFSKPHVTH